MNARFEVIEAIDVFADPGGHFRHHSVLAGHLLEGSLSCGQSLTLKLATEEQDLCVAARIGGFSRFRDDRVNRARSIDAAVIGSAPVGVMLVWPAVLKEMIAQPSIATTGEDAELERTLSAALEPEYRPLFLHEFQMSVVDREVYGWNRAPRICTRCLEFFRAPALKSRLVEALDDPREIVVLAAAQAILRFGERAQLGSLNALASHSSAHVRALLKKSD